jgi:hypothetical protein
MTNMKMRLLCVLVLIVFAMGCKDEKKEKDEDDKESTEQPTEGGEATGGGATCEQALAHMISEMKTAGAPAEVIAGIEKNRAKMLGDCEREMDPACVLKLKGEEVKTARLTCQKKAADKPAGTKGGSAKGGSAKGGDASCASVYDKLTSVMRSAGAPEAAIASEFGEKGEFVADCEKESTSEQRNCIIKAEGMEAVGACMGAQ